MGRNKVEWLWVLGLPIYGDIPSLILSEVALSLSKLVDNLGVFLGSQILLEEQVSDKEYLVSKLK